MFYIFHISNICVGYILYTLTDAIYSLLIAAVFARFKFRRLFWGSF